MLDNRRKKQVAARLSLAAVALVLLLAEFFLLLHMRSYMPCGIGPALKYESLPPELEFPVESDRTGFIRSDLDTLALKVGEELEYLDPSVFQTDLIMASAIRDWTRRKAGGIGKDIDSRNPCEVLEAMEAGAKAHCEPFAILYMAAIEGFGMHAREIALFAEPGDFHKAHSTVEVWTDSGWVLQDPTFNAVPLSPDGSPLDAAAVQAVYAEGGQVIWEQDVNETEPKMEGYNIPPRELYRYVFYRLHRYPADIPRPKLWLARFIDRLTGRVECVLVTREDFPIGNAVMVGTVDRFLVFPAIIFFVAVLVPWPSRTIRPGHHNT